MTSLEDIGFGIGVFLTILIYTLFVSAVIAGLSYSILWLIKKTINLKKEIFIKK